MGHVSFLRSRVQFASRADLEMARAELHGYDIAQMTRTFGIRNLAGL